MSKDLTAIIQEDRRTEQESEAEHFEPGKAEKLKLGHVNKLNLTVGEQPQNAGHWPGTEKS